MGVPFFMSGLMPKLFACMKTSGEYTAFKLLWAVCHVAEHLVDEQHWVLDDLGCVLGQIFDRQRELIRLQQSVAKKSPQLPLVVPIAVSRMAAFAANVSQTSHRT